MKYFGQRWIAMDSDGYIITHNEKKKAEMKLSGENLIAMDNNGQ